MALYNRVKLFLTAGGTGALSLGAAVSMYRDFSGAGIPTGTVVSYVIEDAVNSLWEYGRGTYTAPSTFTRTTILATSAGNTTAINAAASSILFIDALAEDFVSSVSVGSTAISGGTSGRVLFDNGGNIGEAVNLTYDGTATSARQLKLTGSTSGAVTLQTQGVAGTYTLTLPNAVPTVAGQSLTSDTSGNLSWTSEAAANVTFAASQRVLGRNTAGAGAGEEVSAPQLLDWIGSTQGQLLYRSAGGWTALAAGTAGQYLASGGAAANPSWTTLPASAVSAFSATANYAANDIVTYQGKLYSAKAAITAGAWNATQWNDLGAASYTLPAATAAALGGVFATARPAATAGRFVAGITVTGALDYQRVALTTDVDGILPVANGGTGLSAAGTALQYLRTNAGATALEWATLSAGVVMAFSATTAYSANDLVAYQGKIYSAPGAIAAGAWNAANWTTLSGDAFLNVSQNWTKGQAGTPVAITTGTVDFSLSNNFKFTSLTTAVTMGAPTNLKEGQSGVIAITQGGGGSMLFTNTNWKFEGGTVPTLSTTAGSVDLLVYYATSSTVLNCRLLKAMA